MAKQTAVSIFDFENSYSKGAGFFPDGPARIETARFGTFDYGKPGADKNVLILMCQALAANGEDSGEVRPIYYGLGSGVDLITPIKNEKGMYSQIAIAEDSEHDRIFGLCDFAMLMDSLSKHAGANFDCDGAENDICELDGLTVEFVTHVKPNTSKKPKKDADGGKEAPEKAYSVLLFAEILGKGDVKVTPKKGADKGKAKDEPKSKKAKEVGDGAEDIVEAYLDANLTDDANGGQVLSFKMGISAYAKKTLNKSADVAKEAADMLKENFDALLTSRGWKVDKNKLVQE